MEVGAGLPGRKLSNAEQLEGTKAGKAVLAPKLTGFSIGTARCSPAGLLPGLAPVFKIRLLLFNSGPVRPTIRGGADSAGA